VETFELTKYEEIRINQAVKCSKLSIGGIKTFLPLELVK
jgi:hypothetical protein